MTLLVTRRKLILRLAWIFIKQYIQFGVFGGFRSSINWTVVSIENTIFEATEPMRCSLLAGNIHANEPQTHSTEESLDTTIISYEADSSMEENIQDKTEVIIENIDLMSSSDEKTWSSQNSSKHENSKNIPVIFLEKFHLQNLLRPIQQKWKEIQDLLTYPFHPNYGGLILLSPHHILDKLKEKGSSILGGAHNSIFGVAHAPPDYPYPYKRTGKMQ